VRDLKASKKIVHSLNYLIIQINESVLNGDASLVNLYL